MLALRVGICVADILECELAKLCEKLCHVQAMAGASS